MKKNEMSITDIIENLKHAIKNNDYYLFWQLTRDMPGHCYCAYVHTVHENYVSIMPWFPWPTHDEFPNLAEWDHELGERQKKARKHEVRVTVPDAFAKAYADWRYSF